MAWELKGKYPAILSDANVGAEARKLFNDAERLLERIVRQHLLTARAVYGFFPANSDGDDIIVFVDDSRSCQRARFPMLRQQWEREGQTSFRSLGRLHRAAVQRLEGLSRRFRGNRGLGYG